MSTTTNPKQTLPMEEKCRPIGPSLASVQLRVTKQQAWTSGGIKQCVVLVALFCSRPISRPLSTSCSRWKPLFSPLCLPSNSGHSASSFLPSAARHQFCLFLSSHHFSPSSPLPRQNKEGAVGRRGWNKCKWGCRESD